MSELIERLRNVWDNLSAREQILVGTAGAVLAISLVVFAVVMPFFSVIEGARSRVQSAEQSLMAMVRLQREYAEIDGRLSTVEGRIQ
ncbi:type II secretion system protein M, partial [Myxococcota bacterium]|nr:type II secretion system protein M [Myxococcota bacterium]